jgi:hypothetical protein
VQTYHAAAGNVAADSSHHDVAGTMQWGALRHHETTNSRSYQRSGVPLTEVFTLTKTAARRLERQLWTLQVQWQLSSWRSNSLIVIDVAWQGC